MLAITPNRRIYRHATTPIVLTTLYHASQTVREEVVIAMHVLTFLNGFAEMVKKFQEGGGGHAIPRRAVGGYPALEVVSW